jgi:hypothetical protein
VTVATGLVRGQRTFEPRVDSLLFYGNNPQAAAWAGLTSARAFSSALQLNCSPSQCFAVGEPSSSKL